MFILKKKKKKKRAVCKQGLDKHVSSLMPCSLGTVQRDSFLSVVISLPKSRDKMSTDSSKYRRDIAHCPGGATQGALHFSSWTILNILLSSDMVALGNCAAWFLVNQPYI
jgi:hypothetical protein